MRTRFFALASGLATLAATPCLALTISSAPPSRDAAPHLTTSGSSGPRLQDTFAGSGRPMAGSNFGGAPVAGATSFGFGPVRTTVTGTPHDPRWSDPRWSDPRWNDRRDPSGPLYVLPPRR